ncbi:glycoside hydrolase family 16 protein [Mucilaginibacter pallidiroseus]|uniref:Glycoside hydrolase family 16 protein n=1 Tax=Mucilaginibacter pallidiroseus TaxID=2599295 RepID=A0A563U356_9SPHI|nr:glycoside hydrolase family 16 protein [Mucilaginibacter pallidiroseus]TWR25786.1 glycoside hydrolase family 16 protein [Mucilaginibacter pallidiroseus]
MKINLLTLPALMLLSATAMAQSKKDTVFFDDFRQGQLDRSKWNVEITGRTVNDEQQAYIDSAATIYLTNGKADGANNGMLVLKALYKPGHTSKEGNKYDFVSGRINTRDKMMFKYGTASARVKVTAGPGLWPAFWALGKGNWPDCGEIDVMETVGDVSWTSNALHGPGYFGNTPIAFRAHMPKTTNAAKWHIYSVDWSPMRIVFKVDGKVTYTVTKQKIEKYGRWVFDEPEFLILNFALGGGYPNGVNKVTKPYFGLSQSSVDKIKAGNAKYYVDWVLVTK